MIPTSIFNISWSFTAVPVWEWVPADAARPAPDAPTPDTDDPARAGRLVVKGYEWQPVAGWEWLANTDWQHWSDSQRDDAAARARKDERARSALPPPLPAPQVPEQPDGTREVGSSPDPGEPSK